MLKIATWNINSIRLRLPALEKFIQVQAPDILCLQETKVQDKDFPIQACQDLGYPHTVFSGEKSYNGVAMLSRIPLRNVAAESFCNGDKRHIYALLPQGIELHNFYIPAGGDIPDPEENPKFDHKLRFVDAMREWFQAKRDRTDPIIIVGDFNIAPFEHDVWSHRQLLSVVSHTPIEVEKLTKLQKSLGWIDSSRLFVPLEKKLYSWWSYRNQDWKKSDRGRRLDHIWTTPALKSNIHNSLIFREARDWNQPSDHVPVITEFRI